MDLIRPRASGVRQTSLAPTAPVDQRLIASSTAELLAQYGSILSVLRDRGIVRSENSPVGDYAEYLAAHAFALTLVGSSARGYDGVDDSGVRCQVKGRRITRWNSSRQLSTIRGLDSEDGDPFDLLAGILFDDQFMVTRAALVPVAIVRARATLQTHVNGWRFMLAEALWDVPGVVDVTERIRAVVPIDDAGA